MSVVDITPKQDQGVLKEIIKEGIGDETPPSLSTVTLQYVATLSDGTILDSSKERGKPLRFKVGADHVIPALDICIPTMKKGEIAVIRCQPNYAYGEIGNTPKIPPNTPLIFKIKLISWKERDLTGNQDCGIKRYCITEGTGCRWPVENCMVDVHIIGKYNNSIFEERDVTFDLGSGKQFGIISGVEKALYVFLKGEKSRLVIESKYAFGEEGNERFNIPPNSRVEYIVELKNFTECQPKLLSKEQYTAEAKMFKEKAERYIKADRYNLAIQTYSELLAITTPNYAEKCDDLEEFHSVVKPIYLNCSLCHLKCNDYRLAKHWCNKVLEIDSENEKALFRRGQAYLGLGEPERAIKDFQEVVRIEPKNTAAKNQILICNNSIKKYVENEKKLYWNMFDKFAKEDKQKEEEELLKQPDVMRGTLGEWGQEERPGGRDATAFEKENPNILMLNANGTDEFQNM